MTCGTRLIYLKISTAKRLTIPLKSGEIMYDKDLQQLFYGDGVTMGGKPFAGNPYIVASKNVNYTINNEDFIRAFGNAAITFTLPLLGIKPITIKNTSTQILTLVGTAGAGNPSGLINGVSNIQLDALLTGGFAEGNLGESVTLHFEGGQFWVN